MDLKESLTAFAGFTLLLPVLYLLGRVFKSWISLPDEGLQGIFYQALGLGVLALLVSFLGLLGQFRPVPVLILTAVVLAAGIKQIPEFAGWFSGSCKRLFGGRTPAEYLTGLSLLLVFGLALLLNQLPEVANDALCYQLNVAKQFAWKHSLVPDVYDFNSYTSILMNSLYAIGLLFQSVPLAKMFHAWAALLLTGAMIFTLEKETGAAWRARILGLLFFLTPTVFFEVTTTYVDLATSLFVFLSFYAWIAWRESGRTGDAALSGLLLGFAISTKVLFMIAAAPFALLFLAEGMSQRRQNIFKDLAAFGMGALLGTVYWFIQAYALTGNPIFPYMGSLFGTAQAASVQQFMEMGPKKSLLLFFLLPWNMTFRPQDYDGGFPLGPLYLLLLPFVVYGFWKQPKLRAHSLFAGVFLAIWYFLFHNVRFLLPVLTIYAVAGTAGFFSLWRRLHAGTWWKRIFLAGAAGLALLLLGAGIYHYRHEWPLIAGRTNRTNYLAAMERTAPLAQWMEKSLPKDARIFNAEEIRQFYFPRDSVREIWFSLKTHYEELEEPEKVAAFLKKEGFTYLLMEQTEGQPVAPKNSRYVLLHQLAANSTLTEEKGRVASVNRREQKAVYHLYRLR